MIFVEPICDRKKIAQIKNLLRGQKRFRDLLLFVVGINSALRISDLLNLLMYLSTNKRKMDPGLTCVCGAANCFARHGLC